MSQIGKFYVKTMTGQSHSIEYKPTKTILQVITDVMSKTGLGKDQIQLIYAGNPIGDKLTSTLQQCGVEPNGSVFLVARLKGGASQ